MFREKRKKPKGLCRGGTLISRHLGLGHQQKGRCNAQSSLSAVNAATTTFDIYDSKESSRKPMGLRVTLTIKEIRRFVQRMKSPGEGT